MVVLIINAQVIPHMSVIFTTITPNNLSANIVGQGARHLSAQTALAGDHLPHSSAHISGARAV
jgi:hypothetical protein